MKITGFYAILQKEILHLLRDYASLLFALIPPVMQVIAFGYAINTDVRDLSTVVYNQDKRGPSLELLNQFTTTGTFKIAHSAHSLQELSRFLVENRATVGINIPPDFSDHVLRGEPAQVGVYIDGSNNTIALTAMATANGLGFKSASAQPIIDIRPRVLFNPDLLTANFFVPGIIGIAIQLSLTMLVAFAIVRERETGTLEQLLVSPATPVGLLLGKLIPYVIFAFLEMLLLTLVMRYIFQVRIHGSILLLFIMSGVYSMAIVGIGLLISQAARNQLQATQMAMATLLPSIFLTGFLYPRDTMPDILYLLGFIIPFTYFLNILRGIILRGADFANLLPSIIPLSLMALFLFTTAVLKFRKRLD